MLHGRKRKPFIVRLKLSIVIERHEVCARGDNRFGMDRMCFDKLREHGSAIDQVIVNGDDQAIGKLLKGPIIFLMRFKVPWHPMDFEIAPKHARERFGQICLAIWEVLLGKI